MKNICIKAKVAIGLPALALLLFTAIRGNAEPTTAASYAGEWTSISPCKGARGAYKKRCADGAEDIFELYDMYQEGNRICSHHRATSHLGEKIDESEPDERPSINGLAKGNMATVAILGSGKAHLRLAGNRLYWDIVVRPNTVSSLPDHAVLIRASPTGGNLSRCEKF